MLMSMASLTVGHVCFAFARPLWLAICIRLVLLGGLNGWPTLTGLLAREVGGTEREHTALGQIYAAAGVMVLVAPGVGAGLYGINIVGDQFPAAAPSFVGAFFAGSALIATWLFIPETRPDSPAKSIPSEDLISPESATEQQNVNSFQSNLCNTLRKQPFPLLLGLRSALGIIEMATNDVIPLFMIASTRNGGLDLPVKHLGMVLMLSAAVSSLYISLVSARVQKYAGNDRVVIGGTLVQALMLGCLLVFPSLPLDWPFPLLAAIPLSIFQIGFTHVFGGLVAAFNAAVAEHPEQAGVLNGVGASCMAAAMAAGPLIAAPPFAAAIHSLPPDHDFPKLLSVLLDGASIVWGALALLLLVIAIFTCIFAHEIRLPVAPAQTEQLLPKNNALAHELLRAEMHKGEP